MANPTDPPESPASALDPSQISQPVTLGRGTGQGDDEVNKPVLPSWDIIVSHEDYVWILEELLTVLQDNKCLDSKTLCKKNSKGRWAAAAHTFFDVNLSQTFRRTLKETATRHTVFKQQLVLNKCYSALKVYLDNQENAERHGKHSIHRLLLALIVKYEREEEKKSKLKKKVVANKAAQGKSFDKVEAHLGLQPSGYSNKASAGAHLSILSVTEQRKQVGGGIAAAKKVVTQMERQSRADKDALKNASAAEPSEVSLIGISTPAATSNGAAYNDAAFPDFGPDAVSAFRPIDDPMEDDSKLPGTSARSTKRSLVVTPDPQDDLDDILAFDEDVSDEEEAQDDVNYKRQKITQGQYMSTVMHANDDPLLSSAHSKPDVVEQALLSFLKSKEKNVTVENPIDVKLSSIRKRIKTLEASLESLKNLKETQEKFLPGQSTTDMDAQMVVLFSEIMKLTKEEQTVASSKGSE
jgi:hypothetical protein